MATITNVNPFRCRVWDLHDRLEASLDEDSCRAEIESFEKHGQLIPALGRPLYGDPLHDVELVYGARRLFAARHINQPLKVELRQMSDLEAIIAMDIENRQRKDISPYERALSYAHWLRAGLFESQDELARTLKVSPSLVSRLLKLARLPAAVVDAFDTGIDIREGWGLQLCEIIDDPSRRDRALLKAREIAALSPRPPAREVYQQLLASAAVGRRPKKVGHDKVVKAETGAILFRVSHRSDSIALLLPLQTLSARCLEQIERAVANILQDRIDSKNAIGPVSRIEEQYNRSRVLHAANS